MTYEVGVTTADKIVYSITGHPAGSGSTTRIKNLNWIMDQCNTTFSHWRAYRSISGSPMNDEDRTLAGMCGKVMVLSLNLGDNEGSWTDITAGNWDTDLTQWSNAIQDYENNDGGKVYLSVLAHEPANGDTNRGTSPQYINAAQRLVTVVKNAGWDEGRFFWCNTMHNMRGNKATGPIASTYQNVLAGTATQEYFIQSGDSLLNYVDIIGPDGYSFVGVNTADQCFSDKTFQNIFQVAYDWARGLGKKFAVSETGHSYPGPNGTSSAPAYQRDYINAARNWCNSIDANFEYVTFFYNSNWTARCDYMMGGRNNWDDNDPAKVAFRSWITAGNGGTTTPAPTANFSGSPLTGLTPLTVQFTDQSTGSITSRAWDFTNNGSTDSTATNPSNQYTTGTYTVKLTVTGPGGADSEIKTNYVDVNEVLPAAPVAAFSANPLIGDAPLSVQFTDASTGSVSSYAWNFGDGQTATTQNPLHIFTTAGTYTVTLTVTGPGGSDAEVKTGYITLTADTFFTPVEVAQAATRSATSVAGTFQGTAAATDLIIVVAAADNHSTTTGETAQITVTDSASNTYTRTAEATNSPAGVQTGVTTGIFISQLTSPLGGTGSITVSGGGTGAIAFRAYKWVVGDVGWHVNDKTVGVASNSTASPSLTLSNVAAGEESLILVATATEGPWNPPDTYTPDTDYTNLANRGTGVADDNSNLWVHLDYRSGFFSTDTFTATNSAARDWAGVMVAIQAIPDPDVPDGKWNIPAIIATGTDNAGNLVLSLNRDVIVGETLVTAVAADNAGTTDGASTEITVTDTQSHTWTRLKEQRSSSGVANDGAVAGLFATEITTALTAGVDTITVAHTAADASSAIVVAVEYGS